MVFGLGLGLGGPSVAAEVTFQCRYLKAVNITSSPFETIQATATTTKAGYGTLDNSFALTIFSADDFTSPLGSEIVYIGSRLYVSVDMTMQSLQASINFFIETCNLLIGEIPVAIIKDQCFSNALGVYLEDSNATTKRFSFTAFSADENAVENAENIVQCKLRICIKSSAACDPPVSCPASAGYRYTTDGYVVK